MLPMGYWLCVMVMHNAYVFFGGGVEHNACGVVIIGLRFAGDESTCLSNDGDVHNRVTNVLGCPLPEYWFSRTAGHVFAGGYVAQRHGQYAGLSSAEAAVDGGHAQWLFSPGVHGEDGLDTWCLVGVDSSLGVVLNGVWLGCRSFVL